MLVWFHVCHIVLYLNQDQQCEHQYKWWLNIEKTAMFMLISWCTSEYSTTTTIDNYCLDVSAVKQIKPVHHLIHPQNQTSFRPSHRPGVLDLNIYIIISKASLAVYFSPFLFHAHFCLTLFLSHFIIVSFRSWTETHFDEPKWMMVLSGLNSHCWFPRCPWQDSSLTSLAPE